MDVIILKNLFWMFIVYRNWSNLVSECQDQFNLEVTNVPPGGGYWEWVDGPDDSSLSFDQTQTHLLQKLRLVK